MNFWNRHIGDIIRDTVSLTMLEDGAYTRLLDQYYQTERPLPLDKKMIYRLARATSTAERKACDFVIETFFTAESDGFHQKRCDIEIAAYAEKQRKAQASANARWNKSEGNANASKTHDASDMRTHSEGNAHQSPITNHQEPEKDSGTSIVSGTSASRAHANPPRNAGDWASYFRDRYGVEIDVSSVHERKKVWPIFTAWCNARLTLEQIDEAVIQARKQAKQPIAFLPSYVDRVLASQAQGVGIDNDAVNAEAAALLFGDDALPEVIHG